MADGTPSLPPAADSTPVARPHLPAPHMPLPSAIASTPLTGHGGPVGDPVPLAAATAPPARPPRRPPALAALPAAAVPAATPAAAPWLVPGPAMTSLVTHALNSARPASQKFTLMVLPEDGWPAFEDFEDVGLLVGRIKQLVGTQCCLFAFLGHRLDITAGPHRFLQTPMGALPLFDIPAAGSAPSAQFGWVGGDMDTPQAPTTDHAPQQQQFDEGDTDMDLATATTDDPLATPVF